MLWKQGVRGGNTSSNSNRGPTQSVLAFCYEGGSYLIKEVRDGVHHLVLFNGIESSFYIHLDEIQLGAGVSALTPA